MAIRGTSPLHSSAKGCSRAARPAIAARYLELAPKHWEATGAKRCGAPLGSVDGAARRLRGSPHALVRQRLSRLRKPSTKHPRQTGAGVRREVERDGARLRPASAAIPGLAPGAEHDEVGRVRAFRVLPARAPAEAAANVLKATGRARRASRRRRQSRIAPISTHIPMARPQRA